MAGFCQLWLACADEDEASKIADNLLKKRLIVCAKQVPINSDFWWEGKIDKSKEVLLVMESREDLFDKVESEIEKLHSYDTFVLQALPMTKVSKKAEKWMKESITEG